MSSAAAAHPDQAHRAVKTGVNPTCLDAIPRIRRWTLGAEMVRVSGGRFPTFDVGMAGRVLRTRARQ